MINQQRDEQREQVPDAEFERLDCRMWPAVAVQRDGPVEEARAQQHRGGQVQRAAHVDGEGHEADRQQHRGVEQDVHLGVVHAMGHRQHRHVDLGVLVLAVNGQRPEVRRRPGEDDQHQQQRLGGDLAGYRDPAEQGRCSAGQAADDDVLRRGALEKAGIDHRVTDQRGQRQPGGEGIGEGQQQGQPADAEDEGEGQCRRR